MRASRDARMSMCGVKRMDAAGGSVGALARVAVAEGPGLPLTVDAFAGVFGWDRASSIERTCGRCGRESDRGLSGKELFPFPVAAELVPLAAVGVSAGGWVATRVSPLTFAVDGDHTGTGAVVEALEVPLAV